MKFAIATILLFLAFSMGDGLSVYLHLVKAGLAIGYTAYVWAHPREVD